jgi:hypothetical protein
VVANPRLGRNSLHHHPVRALDPYQAKKVLDFFVVAPPCACDGPRNVVESHLDLASDDGRIVLLVQSWPGHGCQRVGKLAHD